MILYIKDLLHFNPELAANPEYVVGSINAAIASATRTVPGGDSVVMLDGQTPTALVVDGRTATITTPDTLASITQDPVWYDTRICR